MSSETGSSSDADSNLAQRDSILEQFQAVTGTNNDSARAILEACNWNLELAINMHVDGIESNDLVELPANRSSNNLNTASIPTESNHSDFVRAPIPPVREVLVDDNFHSPVILPRRPINSVFDTFRDFQAEARWQEQLQAASSNGESSTTDQSTISKKQTLEDLYRPPLDIMFRGTLEACKEEGTKQNRWLLVNIQNVKEFTCQVLNRDVWSNPTIKEIIKEHFIFWQICHEQTEGQRFVQFYNVHSYPHVSILDPRTGEKLNTFSATDADSLCEFITEFINEHPTPNGQSKSSTSALPSSSSGSSSKRDSLTRVGRIFEQSEDAQLEAAIAASLREIKQDDKMKNDDEDSISSADIQLNPEVEKQAFGDDKEEDWKDYLAAEDGNQAQFKLRFPDNAIDQISFPANSQVKALLLYIKSKGFDPNQYEITTQFPRRVLNDISPNETLVEAKLCPKTFLCITRK